MEDIKEKSNIQESSFTNVLRMLCRQKESIANNFKTENERLNKLLLKQQSLLNKLNEDNMALNRDNRELKLRNEVNKSAMKYSSKLTKEGLIEQNKSLKEQLLVAQSYSATVMQELSETKSKLKLLSKKRKAKSFDNKSIDN